MEILGQIDERAILYCNVRTENDWFEKLPEENWIAFTIVDKEDEEFLRDMTAKCIERKTCYTVSTGQLGSITEDSFDWRIVEVEQKRAGESETEEDYERTPMTSFHLNFSEGFWFATVVAKQIIYDEYVISKEVVCIDCTKRKVRGHLLKLIAMINDRWLPSDDARGDEPPVYDED